MSVMRLEVNILKLSKFKYSFSEAKKNVIRNGLMSVASLFTIASCLVILGVFTLLTLNVNTITGQIKDQCEIQLYMNIDATDDVIAYVGEQIKTVENVKECSLYTKEELLKYAQEDMFEGNEGLLEGFEEDNPFADSYKVVLHDIKKTTETAEILGKIEGVERVINKQDVVNFVLYLSDAIKKFSIAIMIVLLIIAMVIISNTVKLTVYNRRKEINIMKYIGATDRFIRAPFVLEGLIIGFVGAVLAFILVFWPYFAILSYMKGLNFTLFELVPLSKASPLFGGLFLVFGCLIGVCGSAISMRKYLQV